MNRRKFLKTVMVGTAGVVVPLKVNAEHVSFKVKPVYGRCSIPHDWDGKSDYFWQGHYWTRDEVKRLYERGAKPLEINWKGK